MAVTISGTSGVTTNSGVTLQKYGAAANFGALMNDTTSQLIMNAGASGTTVRLYRTFSTPKNISVDTTNNWWTHTYTGYYQLFISFRQASGNDIWNAMAVTKNGATDVVGTSARFGSENAHTELIPVQYRVDSTTANYRLQGWSLGDTYAGGGPSGNPGWVGSGYGGYTEIGNAGSYIGKCYDIIVYRIGDL